MSDKVARVSLTLEDIASVFDEEIWDLASAQAGFIVSGPAMDEGTARLVDGCLEFDVTGYNEAEEEE